MLSDVYQRLICKRDRGEPGMTEHEAQVLVFQCPVRSVKLNILDAQLVTEFIENRIRDGRVRIQKLKVDPHISSAFSYGKYSPEAGVLSDDGLIAKDGWKLGQLRVLLRRELAELLD